MKPIGTVRAGPPVCGCMSGLLLPTTAATIEAHVHTATGAIFVGHTLHDQVGDLATFDCERLGIQVSQYRARAVILTIYTLFVHAINEYGTKSQPNTAA